MLPRGTGINCLQDRENFVYVDAVTRHKVVPLKEVSTYKESFVQEKEVGCTISSCEKPFTGA